MLYAVFLVKTRGLQKEKQVESAFDLLFDERVLTLRSLHSAHAATDSLNAVV